MHMDSADIVNITRKSMWITPVDAWIVLIFCIKKGIDMLLFKSTWKKKKVTKVNKF